MNVSAGSSYYIEPSCRNQNFQLESFNITMFSQLRDTAMMYGLPHPMSLLNAPMRPEKFRSLVKDKVAEYWYKKTYSRSSQPAVPQSFSA